MEIRVIIAPDGRARIESISALEDLWHDYKFFSARGGELGQPSATETDRLLAKRYYRAALLALVCYLEGVLNRWLQQVLSEPKWRAVERQCVERKMELVQAHSAGGLAIPDIGPAKRLRNMLVHLKPGADGELYDKVNGELLLDTEKQVLAWLAHIEASTQLRRHPDTRAESRLFTEALGNADPEAEGYTTQEEGPRRRTRG